MKEVPRREPKMLRALVASKLPEELAKALYVSRWWEGEDFTQAEVAMIQLKQERLIVPFGLFQDAVTELLGRPVYTHEFSRPEVLIAEAEGRREAPRSPVESLREVAPNKPAVAVMPDGNVVRLPGTN